MTVTESRHGDVTRGHARAATREVTRQIAYRSPAHCLLSWRDMKKANFKKLVVSSETIRNLGNAQLGQVTGGVLVVNTTHSIVIISCGSSILPESFACGASGGCGGGLAGG